MATVNPYLNFNGNTEDEFTFYKTVFGGEFTTLQRFKDTPHAEQMPESDRGKIMHISLPIGKNIILMATDTLESMGQSLTIGTNYSLCISPESEEEANQFFKALSEGGEIGMPLEKMFWGAYF